jgi:hypothetical protein
MRLEINPRGNGACPLCVRLNSCSIKKAIRDSVLSLKILNTDTELEVVVYSCPEFKESN